MNLILAAAEWYIPDFLKRREFGRMFALTAEAFGAEMPELQGLSYADMLIRYARFTAEQAARLKIDGGVEEARRRLARASYTFGQRLRRQFRIRNRADALRLVKLIYHMSGIEMKAVSADEIIFTHCLYKNYYTPDTCRLVSALDEGMVTGLSGCPKFEFRQRLTEGHPLCRARLE